jgi:hypothetical protein
VNGIFSKFEQTVVEFRSRLNLLLQPIDFCLFPGQFLDNGIVLDLSCDASIFIFLRNLGYSDHVSLEVLLLSLHFFQPHPQHSHILIPRLFLKYCSSLLPVLKFSSESGDKF